jgi:tetratricopeptide (TPR) repeat protein
VNRILRGLAIAVVALFAVPIASADDPAPTPVELAAAKAAFNESNALYKAGKLVEAIAKLEESYRLSRNAILLFNIGRIYDKVGQPDKVLFYYRKFLRDAPADAPLRDDATKRIGELEKDVVVVPDVEPDPTPPPAPDSKYSPADFKHEVIDSVRPGKQVDVIASLPPGSDLSVTLFYRRSGDETFVADPMKWQDSVLVAHIPDTKVVGNWLHYYLEVRDPAGTLITRSGKSTSPHLVNIEAAVTVMTPRLPDDPLRDRPDDRRPGKPLRPGKWIASGAAVALIAGAVVLYARAGQQHDLLVIDATSCGTPPCREFDAAYAQGVESRGVLYDRLYKVSVGLAVGTVALSGYLWYRDVTRKKPPDDVGVAITPAFGAGFLGAALGARF